jgi:hypothetical protein
VVAGLLVIVAGAFFVFRPEPAAPLAEAPADAPAPAPEPPTPASPPPAASTRPSSPRAAAPAPAPPADAEPPSAEAAPAVTLRVDSDVPGAQVFIDRQFIGAAPVTTTAVAPGTHQINVSAPGFDGHAETIELAPGSRDIMVRFKVVQLDARIDVVHKQRFGDCRGTLVATPQGLRYETTNRDDAFSAPLTGVEELQVDYLEKNLRVRPNGGRQYNFTDPDGNADRLFVFQRDVNRARARLIAGDEPATP